MFSASSRLLRGGDQKKKKLLGFVNNSRCHGLLLRSHPISSFITTRFYYRRFRITADAFFCFAANQIGQSHRFTQQRTGGTAIIVCNRSNQRGKCDNRPRQKQVRFDEDYFSCASPHSWKSLEICFFILQKTAMETQLARCSPSCPPGSPSLFPRPCVSSSAASADFQKDFIPGRRLRF